MSQNLFVAPAKTGEPLNIMCGFDRPLDYFFLSIRPVDEEKYEDREDLHFESMYTMPRGGYSNVDQVLHQLHCMEIKYPRGLGIRLQQDQEADWQSFRNKVINNRITRWPLAEAEQLLLDIEEDKRIIMSVLANDEESSNEELVDVIVESVKGVTAEQVKAIVAGERTSFFTDSFHEIDFDEYLEGEQASV